MKKLGIFVCMLAIVTLFAACGDTTQKTDSNATTVPSASESGNNINSCVNPHKHWAFGS